MSAQESAILEANPAPAVSPRGRFFTNQTFHFETLRNAGYVLSQCADLGEMLETTKHITEGDLESWYNAWAATANRVEVLAARTEDTVSKGDAYMEDHFIPFHQVADFEKSLISARSVITQTFDRDSGGGEHCQCGNTSLVHAAVFDWLIQTFPAV